MRHMLRANIIISLKIHHHACPANGKGLKSVRPFRKFFFFPLTFLSFCNE